MWENQVADIAKTLAPFYRREEEIGNIYMYEFTAFAVALIRHIPNSDRLHIALESSGCFNDLKPEELTSLVAELNAL